MRTLTLLVGATLFLGACATDVSEPLPGCGSVVEWSPEIQAQAADELDALPADAVLLRFIEDYGAMREEARACREGT